ncbi:protein MID1-COMPLEMENTING ACTIVITY 2 [Silene latifolia]|uniref:protein MID1-COMPLEMENTING ACTIVITY 2 n=1 Tax=Silene latifolia TaxID=37657 RepID=UPI003D76A797
MAELSKEVKMGVGCEKEEEEKLIEGTSVLDFDVLCSTVVMQSQGKWRLFENDEEEEQEESGGGGVLRMWEGEVLDCFDDRRIAVQSFFCPCYRFGKNMKRAGQGSCYIQGTVYLLLAISAFVNCVAFIVTRKHCFLYLAIAFTISVGTYLGFFRTQMRKKFNIKGTDSAVDDCVYHLICPCCSISQESRTLEMNNVQGGTWHGRGDTICVGTFGESAKSFVELHPPPPVIVQFHEPKLMPENETHSNC